MVTRFDLRGIARMVESKKEANASWQVTGLPGWMAGDVGILISPVDIIKYSRKGKSSEPNLQILGVQVSFLGV